MQQNELLAKENRLFESYLQRHCKPEDIEAMRRSRKMPTGELSQYQRLTLAQQELDFRQSQLKQLEEKATEDIALLKSITAGIKIRISEMRKETYEFKRDIVIGGENTRTGKIMAEKVIRYYEEQAKQKTALVEKIKLKNQAMKNHRSKIDQQVKQKEEQGDSLHSIDFHQLQIKNTQFNQKIEERNAELLQLKMTTGRTVHVLNSAKRRLAELLDEQRKLERESGERRGARERLMREYAMVESDVEAERGKNRKYKIQQSNPDMPQVLDYVNQKSTMYDLEAQVHNWQRKCEIMEMAAKRARKILKQASQSSSSPHSFGSYGQPAYMSAPSLSPSHHRAPSLSNQPTQPLSSSSVSSSRPFSSPNLSSSAALTSSPSTLHRPSSGSGKATSHNNHNSSSSRFSSSRSSSTTKFPQIR